MHEAFWNGLFDARWEEAPLGPEALNKAGIVTGRRGAHILRHSLAVHLLRSGETLKSIGDLLGHRRPDTTFIYTNSRQLH